MAKQAGEARKFVTFWWALDAAFGRRCIARPGRNRLTQQCALGRDDVHRLMSIPGVDAIVALSIVAAIGDITRFRSPDKLVCYFGLNPRVRQSGGYPASHGRITKAGPGHARGMLVEAAWAAAKTPGPLRAFYHGCEHDMACRSRWWPPPANSPCCAGTC